MNDPSTPDPLPGTPDTGDAGSGASSPPGDPTSATDATTASGEGPGFPEQRLHRCRDGRMLAGVAAGAADYLGIDPTLVRIGFVALAFLGGLAVPLYLAGWLLIPEEGTGSSIAEGLLVHDRAW